MFHKIIFTFFVFLDRSSNISVFKLTAHKIGEVIFAALALHLQAKTGGGLGDLRWQLSNASVTNFPQHRLRNYILTNVNFHTGHYCRAPTDTLHCIMHCIISNRSSALLLGCIYPEFLALGKLAPNYKWQP